MPQLTINTTTAQANRIAKAFGKVLGLVDGDENPRNATAAEIKAHTIQFLKDTVKRVEQNDAAETAREAVDEIDPN